MKQSPTEISEKIIGVDISSWPKIRAQNKPFFDRNGQAKPLLKILKESGVNTIRLRLWVNPIDQHSSFSEVLNFSKEIEAAGLKTWLCIHYSDTWADPGQQKIPERWKNLEMGELLDTVHDYTRFLIAQMKPNYVQIGNEINQGFLFPMGHKNQNYKGFCALLDTCIIAVRKTKPNTKIILHHAGHQGAREFYEDLRPLDFDMIGLSYYPIWHGKSLDSLHQSLKELNHQFEKPIVLAETAYPFTLDWNDLTHNIVGEKRQLILPEYPATPIGQKNFVKDLSAMVRKLSNGYGICYWGAELIAWKGKEAFDASPWENQAFFDFDGKALPVLDAFAEQQ